MNGTRQEESPKIYNSHNILWVTNLTKLKRAFHMKVTKILMAYNLGGTYFLNRDWD